MKLSGNFKEWTVTQTQLGKILGITPGRVNQLIDEEIVQRDESSTAGAVFLIDSITQYYKSKQTYTDDAGKSVNYWTERGLHERVKRQLAEVKLSERRGELYEAETVERVITEQLTDFRNKLMGLPAKMAAVIEGKSRAEIYDLLNGEIEATLEELGAWDEVRASIEEADARGDKAGEED